MDEKWIVAVEAHQDGKRFLLIVRNIDGDIVFFPSKLSARGWVMTSGAFPGGESDVVYIKLPEKRAHVVKNLM
ncbi:MAG: hypothetical protein JXM72_00800 [Deltaproteobacteria bacterium]|nr:hypothetical protein [Deltaproteobacteria bacterium]